MLSEQAVVASWRKVFRGNDKEASIKRAEELLDELSPTNPLRHRLERELDEIKMQK